MLKPPGPPRSSPLGVVRQFARAPLRLVIESIQHYGNCVLLPGPFGQNVFLLNDPELIHTALVTQAHHIEKPGALKWIFRSSFGNGLFFSEGEFWRRQRKLAQPAFHYKRIQTYAEGMVHRATQMLAGWPDGDVCDIRKEFSALTLKVVVDALFSTTVESQTEKIYDAMSMLGRAIERQSLNPLLALLPDWAPVPLMQKKRQASITLSEIVNGFIRERRAANNDAGDLLSMLLFAKDETGQSMTDRQLHDEVMTIFIAGHETTAVTLAWIFVELARHPEVEARLQAELDSILNGRPATLADLPNLPYTNCIVKETLRLYPPAWLLLRLAQTDLALGDYSVPRGHQIWISPYALHRNPQFFSDPDQFRPERFETDANGQTLEDRLPKFAYLPFGGGPRICIGNQFALLEARLLLATIAQHYRLSLTPNDPIKMHVGPTLGFENGARLLAQRRV